MLSVNHKSHMGYEILTIEPSSDSAPKVGRKLLWPDKIIAPLPMGTKARIKAVCVTGETLTDFLREAIERELKRRERQKP